MAGRLRLTITLIFVVIVAASCSAASDAYLTGCSTHCSVVFDSDLTCFNKTRRFYEAVVYSVIKSAIAVQTIVAKKTYTDTNQLTDDVYKKMYSDFLNGMSKSKPLNQEDERGLVPVHPYRDVVGQAIIDRVKVLAPTMDVGKLKEEARCAIGCEKSVQPYAAILLGSLGVNFLLLVVGIYLTMRRSQLESRAEKAKATSKMISMAGEVPNTRLLVPAT